MDNERVEQASDVVRGWRAAKGRKTNGVRVKNAGIGLTDGEMELMAKECATIGETLGHRFSKTALVRYWGRQYFGDEQWEAARNLYPAPVKAKRPKRGKAGAGANGQENTPASGETTVPQ